MSSYEVGLPFSMVNVYISHQKSNHYSFKSLNIGTAGYASALSDRTVPHVDIHIYLAQMDAIIEHLCS